MTVTDTERSTSPAREWVDAIALSSLTIGRGVAVLLPSGEQVALFRVSDDGLFAVGNVDPYGRAAVVSRGLVGDRAGEPTVASPLLKQVFSLVDGRCLDDPNATLGSYDVAVVDGMVSVSSSARNSATDHNVATDHNAATDHNETETTSP
ncbi:MAG: nitrite reductase small subunit NirD [Rhodococcus sp. (in: high G+C Gram-positive bacteria)]